MVAMLPTGAQDTWDELTTRVEDEKWPAIALAHPARLDDLNLVPLGPHSPTFPTLHEALRFIWGLAQMKAAAEPGWGGENWLEFIDSHHIQWHFSHPIPNTVDISIL